MEEELKLDQAVPTLTFEPFTETKKEEPKPEPIYEEEALLSEQEKKTGRGICGENRFE